MLNTSNLVTILGAARDHAVQISSKSAVYQPSVDTLTELANQMDSKITEILQTPDPGPRTDLDFSGLDTAISVLKENARISQTDFAGLITLLKQNTPQ